MSVLFSSLSKSIVGHALSSTIARELLVSLTPMFASHSQAKVFRVRFQLTNLSRGDQTIFNYFENVRSLVDSLAATGNPLPDKEVVTYLLNGLGPSNESFITSVTTRAEPLSSQELYQLLLLHESRVSHYTRSAISALEPSVIFSATGNRDQRGCGSSRSG
ncbi:hypothetical protein F2P56_026589 [Juglans regia]|uniref:Retrotransposon gag domain-containing protein n=1 Tax=Juglans regia TaxID=51240 RepID=A0A833U8G5_JUGRE|nr:hypothetical protein F2P56_026589 [Juglans regia]